MRSIETTVKFRAVTSQKGNACLIVQTKVDYKATDKDGKEIIQQLTGVIPQAGNNVPLGEMVKATVLVERGKEGNPTIVGVIIDDKSLNMDWFFDPQMQEGRTLVDL